MLGFVLSFPIEMHLLDDAIRAQILRDVSVEWGATLRAATDHEESERGKWEVDIAERKRSELEPLQDLHELLRANLQNVVDEHDRERKRVTCGPKCEKLQTQITDLQAQSRKYADDISVIARKYENITPPPELLRRIKETEQIKTAIAHEATATDLLTRMIALVHLKDGTNLPSGQKQSAIVTGFIWLLTASFVLFELFPILIKLFMLKSDYHAYLDARRFLAMQKINCYTNDKLLWIRNNPIDAVRRGEMTDELERGAFEDPAIMPPPWLADSV